MIYGSVCSGIEAATVAWHSLGWKPAWFSEIESFPCAVLAHHYPNTPNLGDMTQLHKTEIFKNEPIDLLVGGTPCQSFSVAGLRKGLADPRGNLALHFLKLLDAKRLRWVVWENVPGVLSSNKGKDFGTFLGALVELGYGFAYRVLDAQYFGVPQRRRRVFVVGHLGDWRPAAAVLFERQSLSGNPAPRREARKGTARGFETGPQGGGFTDLAPTLDARCKDGPIRNQLGAGVAHTKETNIDTKPDNLLIPMAFYHTNRQPENGIYKEICPTIKHGNSGSSGIPPAVVYENHAQDSRVKEVSVAPQLNARAGTGGNNLPLVQAFTQNQNGDVLTGEKFPSMGTNQNATGRNTPKAQIGMSVRHLTPRECERLQGFPDDYTLVLYRGKSASDSPRYKALGNSMAVPVMRWIGRRIMEFSKQQYKEEMLAHE